MARPTKAEAALIAQRRADAITLKMAGVDNLAIGLRLHADPTVNSKGESYPCGFGRQRWEQGEEPLSGEALAREVSADISEAHRQRMGALDEAIEDRRALQNAQIEQLLSRLWKQANDGDLFAVDRIAKLMERQARLNGLDAPVQAVVKQSGHVTVSVLPVEEARTKALAMLNHLAALPASTITADDFLGDTGEDDEAREHDPEEGFGEVVDAEIVEPGDEG